MVYDFDTFFVRLWSEVTRPETLSLVKKNLEFCHSRLSCL
jgi:hypothetical protein